MNTKCQVKLGKRNKMNASHFAFFKVWIRMRESRRCWPMLVVSQRPNTTYIFEIFDLQYDIKDTDEENAEIDNDNT